MIGQSNMDATDRNSEWPYLSAMNEKMHGILWEWALTKFPILSGRLGGLRAWGLFPPSGSPPIAIDNAWLLVPSASLPTD